MLHRTIPAENLEPGHVIDDERFRCVMLVRHVVIGPKWVRAWAFHPEANVRPNTPCRIRRGDIVTITSPRGNS